MLEKINLASIPKELREVAQWVVWKTVHRGSEVTKLPFQVNGAMASSTDPATWTTFDDVVLNLAGALQPGFVFSVEDPFCGIDLDGCRNPETGKVEEWARQIILRIGSYAEVSPSKTGVKIFLLASLPKSAKWNVDQAAVCDKKPGIECYDQGRYFAVTGWKLAGVPATLIENQAAVDELLASRPKKSFEMPRQSAEPTEREVAERARQYISRMDAAVSGQRGHDVTFKVSCVAVLGFGLSEPDAMGLLQEFNQRCQPPWTENELAHKIRSAMEQGGDRNYLRFAHRDEIYAVKLPTYREPGQPDETEEPTGTITLTNLRDASTAYLESIKKGGEQLVSTGLPYLDAAIGGGLAMAEMFIMAARPGHGKSAIALQAVHHWTDIGLPCLFASEEMSALALGKRTVQFATSVHQEHWETSLGQVEFEMKNHFAKRAPCFIAESCRTAERLTAVVNEHVEKEGVKCIVVDYAQLLGSAAGKSQYEQLTNVSVALRHIVSEHKIIVLALCQLSRVIEGRESFTPRMSDLRGTGQLEQDADVVVFNVWPWKVDSKEPANRYQFFICKNRNRPINSQVVDCRFEPTRQKFLEEVVNESEQRELDYHQARDWT